MESPRLNHQSAPSLRKNTGAALILTLGMLVLLSGLILSFLLTVRSESTSSKAYEGGTNSRLLADSAVNLVISQIRQASTQPDLAWISQPGLIRTFDSLGKPAKSYKLYSADSLIEEGSFNPALATDLPPASGPTSWKSQPALYTDLNAPIADLNRTDPFDPTKKLLVYPIFDGNHLNSAGQFSLNKDANADIEGFTVDEFSTRGVSMPLKWLYILKDGTLATAKASGSAGDIQIIVPPGKEKTPQGEPNLPTARIAFWTDDETTKLNLNTGSEGTFWDTPTANSQPGVKNPAVGSNYTSSNDTVFEWDLAERMGAQKEYNRYPGHPATTCLSTVFGRQLLLTQQVGGSRQAMIEEINKFIPRVSGGEYDPADTFYDNKLRDNSSQGGSVRAGSASGDSGVNIITPDNDRLYASIDEFLYNPNFAATGTTRPMWRLAPPVSKRDTTREMLEMAKFFLTTTSKAPEQTLANLPRIAIWPEQLSETRRTAFDKLIAFCSTVGPKSTAASLPFYFTRSNADSATADLSPRNLALLAYLKNLTGRPFPGWDASAAPAKSFAAKYPNGDRDQILAEIFDYIRCANLADTSDPSVNASFTQTRPSGAATYFPRDPATGQSTLGQVVPIEMPDGSRGFGRIATISELGLVMIRKGLDELPPADRASRLKIQLALLPKYFSPMAGFCALANNLRLTFEDIKITVKESAGSSHLPFEEFEDPSIKKQPTIYDIGRVGKPRSGDSKVGGTIGWEVLCELDHATPKPSPTDSVVPTANLIVSNNPQNTLTFSGTVTVVISAPANNKPFNDGSEPIVQRFSFKFPEQTVPLPGPTESLFYTKVGAPTGSSLKGSGHAGDESRWYTAQSRSIKTSDAFRSLAAVGNPSNQSVGLQGDLRLIAARKQISNDYFAPYNPSAYSDSARLNQKNHGFRNGWPWWGSAPGSAYGNLVENMTGYDAPNALAVISPDLPAGINGVKNYLGQAGDWDSGPFLVRDGPLCNKPDEGTTPHKSDGVGGFNSATPYIGDDYIHQDISIQSSTFFSPNRQMPSAVMFGSLPTGVIQNHPWQTLLFRPAKYYLPGGSGQPGSGVEHPGSAKYGPPDHLLLDLFWMPIIEPYAISEPFATAGKVNLNQQIAPFTNLRRDTALRAVLKSVKITAINPNQQDVFGDPYISNYKSMSTDGKNQNTGRGGYGVVSRRSIDLPNTLKQITDRLDQNRPFVSASEICDIPLIPADVPTLPNLPAPMKPHVSAGFTANTNLSTFDSKLAAFWAAHRLTGDNALERPYSHIYPRLTTRSNSYTVHLRVQSLAANSRSPSFILKPAQTQATGEFRGSVVIERYLDANSASFVDASGNPATVPANGDTTGLALGPYRFRTVSSKQFGL